MELIAQCNQWCLLSHSSTCGNPNMGLDQTLHQSGGIKIHKLNHFMHIYIIIVHYMDRSHHIHGNNKEKMPKSGKSGGRLFGAVNPNRFWASLVLRSPTRPAWRRLRAQVAASREGCHSHGGTPIAGMVYFMENLIEMDDFNDDLEVPPMISETSSEMNLGLKSKLIRNHPPWKSMIEPKPLQSC